MANTNHERPNDLLGQLSETLSRRDLGKALLASAAVGFGGSMVSSSVAEAQLTSEQKASLSKVLIERILNTRYELDAQGVLTVHSGDEVWSDGGGVFHQSWLLDEIAGLKADPRACLEETIFDSTVHTGIFPGIDLTVVEELLQRAEEAGILDDLNLMYWVLKEKIHVESLNAHLEGVERFNEWVQSHTSVGAVLKSDVHSLVAEYLSQPVTNGPDEDWY